MHIYICAVYNMNVTVGLFGDTRKRGEKERGWGE
jgi:hypothetical protein